MRKILSLSILTLVLTFSFSTFTFAEEAHHTAEEEAEGKAIWDKFQNGELKCENLNDESFDTLGEYFMGQIMGASHETMNDMTIKAMGEEGEEAVHVVLGKRMSGCDQNAILPSNIVHKNISDSDSMMPMMDSDSHMSMMSMMNYESSTSYWIFVSLVWLLLITSNIAVIKWIIKSK